MWKTIQKTIVQGAAFLVPVIVVIVLVTQGVGLVQGLAEPLAKVIPVHSIAGVGVVTLVALALLVVLCFLVGVITRWALAQKFSEAVESKVQLVWPRYVVLKGLAKYMTEGERMFQPVLAQFDDYAQVAVEVGRTEQGLVTLYRPGSPDMWAGSVIHMTADRVTTLDVTLMELKDGLEGLGSNMAKFLDEAKNITPESA